MTNLLEPLLLILFSMFYLSNVISITIITPILVYVVYSTIALRTMSTTTTKLKSIIIYTLFLGGQIAYTSIVVTTIPLEEKNAIVIQVVYILALFAHPVITHLISIKNYQVSYFHNKRGLLRVPFSRLRELDGSIKDFYQSFLNASQTLSPENLQDIMGDLTRIKAFVYTSKDSLNDEYFNQAEQSLEDPSVYIVVSDTGSPASQALQLFSKKIYNHVSISFDYNLDTIISYNGGEKVYPPGLNCETIEFFNKKDDASILVYRLAVDIESKKKMIEKIKKINAEGSAYNAIGMAVKTSFKPNAMFCSQFVYSLLKEGGVAYFNKESIQVKPTDFVELDYRRNLSFEYEITFK